MSVVNFLMGVLFSAGLTLAIVAPSPITIGCAIFNGLVIGISFVLEKA